MALMFTVMAGSAYAGGFYLPEIGTRSTSYGVAFVARSDDLTAIVHNPAGMTQLKGWHFTLQPQYWMTSASYEGAPEATGYPGGTPGEWEKEEVSDSTFVPFAGLSYGMDKVTVGLGIYPRYGLMSEWPDDGFQRFTVVEIGFRTIFISPSVAYEVAKGLSIGATFSYVMLDGKIKKMKYLLVKEDMFELTGDGSAMTMQLGTRYEMDKMTFGLSYQFPTEITLEGDAELDGLNDPTIQAITGKYYTGIDTGELDLSLPGILAVGFMYNLTDELSLELDVNWIQNSIFREYTVDFAGDEEDRGEEATEDNPATFPKDTTLKKRWKDSYAIRLGGQYEFSNKLCFRGGVLFDKSPIPDDRLDATTIDTDKVGIGLGLGQKLGERMTIDYAYMHIFYSEGEVTDSAYPEDTAEETVPDQSTNGKYNHAVDMFSIALTYHF